MIKTTTLKIGLVFAALFCASSLFALDKTGDIVGTYSGDLIVGGEKMEGTVIVSPDESNKTVTLKIPDFKFGGMPLGTISIEGVEVDFDASGKGTIKEKTAEVTITMVVEIKAEVTVNGTFENNGVNLTIDVAAPGGLEIPVTFTGTNSPVGNIKVTKAETRMYVDYGTLYIDTDQRLTTRIYNTLGQMIDQFVSCLKIFFTVLPR